MVLLRLQTVVPSAIFRCHEHHACTNVDDSVLCVTRSDGKHVMNKVRSALHRGSVAALNVYSLNLQNDLLGYGFVHTCNRYISTST